MSDYLAAMLSKLISFIDRPAVQSLKNEVGSLSAASKRLTEVQKQQTNHEGGASTAWYVDVCIAFQLWGDGSQLALARPP